MSKSKEQVIQVCSMQLRARNEESQQEYFDYISTKLEKTKEDFPDLCLVLLPELFSIPYILVPEEIWPMAESLEYGHTSTFLSQLSRKYSVYIGGTVLEVCGVDFFNTFVLFDTDGKLLGTVRKQFPASFERFIFRGEEDSPSDHVIQTPLGKIGVAICYENFKSRVLKKIKKGNVDLLLSPFSCPQLPRNSTFFHKEDVETFEENVKQICVKNAKILGVPCIMCNKSGFFSGQTPLSFLSKYPTYFLGGSGIANRNGLLLRNLNSHKEPLEEPDNLEELMEYYQKKREKVVVSNVALAKDMSVAQGAKIPAFRQWFFSKPEWVIPPAKFFSNFKFCEWMGGFFYNFWKKHQREQVARGIAIREILEQQRGIVSLPNSWNFTFLPGRSSPSWGFFFTKWMFFGACSYLVSAQISAFFAH